MKAVTFAAGAAGETNKSVHRMLDSLLKNRGGRMRNCLRKNTGSLASAAALVVSAMALPANATSNLLTNPGFETPTTNTNPNNVVTGWTLYGSELRANYQNH